MLRSLYVPELHSLVSDYKLAIPKLKRKDGACLRLGLQDNIDFDHPTDIIAAIINLPEFAMVSKLKIEEITAAVSFRHVSFKI